jgi:radical SAM superfamily enzyme YgiQ (UPF0313 family)
MAKRLLLINPGDEARLNAIRVRDFAFPPPSLAYVAALTPPGWDAAIADENVEPLTFEDADLVAITSMTWNAPRAYQIAEQYRRKGIRTVMGGIHASMVPEEATRFVDSIVVGEAESAWPRLIRDFEGNELKPVYEGERTTLENLPKPRNELFTNKYRVGASVQTARGCPIDCEFCSVTVFHGKTYRQRPVEEVLDEIEALECRDLFFSDDNILNYGEEAERRAIQLFRGMKERGLKKRWVTQVGIDFANNPIVMKSAREAGCLGIHIGFESVNEEALRAMRKVRNLKVGAGNYGEVIKRIHDHGIGVHGAFVLGSDGDKKDIFDRTIEFIINSKIDSSSFTIITPLPGTRLYRRLSSEGRILRTNYPDDWKHYDFAEAVFRPQHMTPDELEEGAYRVYLNTTSKMTSLRRAFNSFVLTRNLPMTVVAYSLNRGLRALVEDKWDYVKNAPHPKAAAAHRSQIVAPQGSSEAEMVETP